MIRLRIAHLIDLDRVGGVETMYADLIQASPPPGFEVEHHTIADSLNIAGRFAEPVRRCSRSVSSPKVWHGLKLPRKPYALRAYNRLARIRAVRPDLVLAWNQFTDFRLQSFDLGCPLVYYEHGMSWYQHSARQLQGFFPRVNAAIAASHAAARMLVLKHGVTFPVHECLNPLRPGVLPRNAVTRAWPRVRPLRLGLAARLVPLKAAGLLVLALKHLCTLGVDAEVWIAGDGPERKTIEALIMREGLGAKVRMLGLVDDMAAFYRDIDLFVQTSMHESLSLVCLEAMGHGVPVICARVDGIPEVVRDGITGWCLTPELGVETYAAMTGASTQFTKTVYDPQQDRIIDARLLDPAAIATAISALQSDPARYAACSAAAILQVNQGFGFVQYQERLYDLLARFAKKR